MAAEGLDIAVIAAAAAEGLDSQMAEADTSP